MPQCGILGAEEDEMVLAGERLCAIELEVPRHPDSAAAQSRHREDNSNTAELFFDFGTPGFFFNSVSGYNYSSAATAPSETPIPAGLPLMASTIAGAWLVARRRRNKQKASA